MNRQPIRDELQRSLGELLRGVGDAGQAFIDQAAKVLGELVERIAEGPVDHQALVLHTEQRLADLAVHQLEKLDVQTRQRLRELLVVAGRGVIAGALAAV
jgi:hypothetical protein